MGPCVRFMSNPFPYLARGAIKNRAVGLAGERQYELLQRLIGSQVSRTGRGSDFAVKGLLAASPRLVEIKTGNAILSRLQRVMGPEVVRMAPLLNSALAMALGAAGGVAAAEAVKRFVKKYIALTCGACGHQATLDDHVCPRCGQRLSRRIEFWIAVVLLVAGGIIAIVDLLSFGLNLPLNLLAGGLLGAGADLFLESLWGSFIQPRSTRSSTTG